MRVALDAAFGARPTPRFDPDSEWQVQHQRRVLFDEQFRERGPTADAPFRVRYDLWKACEAAVRSHAVKGA